MKLNFANLTPQQRELTYTLSNQRTIPTLRLRLTSIIPNNTCLAVVVYGTCLGSTMGLALTYIVRSSMFLSSMVEQILIGCLLGDGSIRYVNKGGNPNFTLKQGFVHLEYII